MQVKGGVPPSLAQVQLQSQPQMQENLLPIPTASPGRITGKRKQRPPTEEGEETGPKEKHEKRGWDSWDSREKETFFSCLREYGRNFDKISSKIETKSYDQVRYFYYRLLKKIDRLLAPQVLDRKDHVQVSNALLSFWELNKDTKLESNKDISQLSSALKERMQAREREQQQREAVLSSQPTKALPMPKMKEPPKVVILLSPSDQETSKLLQHAKCNENLQFELYLTQTVNDILRLMVQSFSQLPNLTVHHIRLYLTENRSFPPVNSLSEGQNSGITGNTSIVTLTNQHHGLHSIESLWRLSASAATSKILHIFYSLLTLPPPQKDDSEHSIKAESMMKLPVLNDKTLNPPNQNSMMSIPEDTSTDGFGAGGKQEEIVWKSYYDQFVSQASEDEPPPDKVKAEGKKGQTSFKNLPFLKK